LGQQHGFVLVGHSFGGLVIKSVLKEAHKRAQLTNPKNKIDQQDTTSAKRFLENLKGVVFYAVPHSGSCNLETYYSQCNHIAAGTNGIIWAGFMQNLQPHQQQMEDLSTNFDDTVDEYSINVYAPIKDVVYDEFMHANVH
jgi:hypothetical protein